MTVAPAFHVDTLEGSVAAGPMRAPRNLEQEATGSIHNDAVAQRLGFRGGTVAGSLHMEQFPPLLVELLGERWWVSGSQSHYFRYATTDGEPVRCFARRPQGEVDGRDVQIEIWMDDAQGHRVGEGTASVGAPDRRSALRRRIAEVPEPRELRILAHLEPGREGRPVPVRITEEQMQRRLGVIVEPLEAYTDASIWGERILPPSLEVTALRAAQSDLLPANGHQYGVGLFGAIEVQHLAGPVFHDHAYEARGRILSVSETPKTEYLWYQSILADPATGTDVASMLMMLRFMKASHPAWQG